MNAKRKPDATAGKQQRGATGAKKLKGGTAKAEF